MMKPTSTRSGRRRITVVVAILSAAIVASAALSSASQAIPGDSCRIQASATIATGDGLSGTIRSTNLAISEGAGHWRHTTPAGERFRADIDSASCHTNTGNIGDFEGTGRFAGSDVELTLMGHVEDLASFGGPDWYSMAIFDGATLIYTTAGPVVDGDVRVTLHP
jgi:hypothetical protein